MSVTVYRYILSDQCLVLAWGTAATDRMSFRPGNPALCGSRPLVTPYYCRLGDCCVLCL